MITYTPRPMIQVSSCGRIFRALFDTGSDHSYISSRVAALAREKGIRPQPVHGYVRVADGRTVDITEKYELPIRIGKRTMRHYFEVMPGPEDDMLVGVDLWQKLGNWLPPPPPEGETGMPRVGAIAEGMIPRTVDEETRLRQFLQEELAKFEKIRGPTDRAVHTLQLLDATPIKQRYRPRNPAMQQIIDDAVREMESEGVIEPSSSAWSSPVVVVRKKDGKHRFCIDFRKVNAVTKPDAYPLPHITATLDKLRGAKYLSTLDLKNGYWQVPLAPESRPITAFTIPGRGLMQFRVMPFGLHSAPATFQRLLDSILGPELEPHVFVYLDDIIIASPTFDTHLRHLAEVFRRLRNAKLRLNPEKCQFCRAELQYLGHVVTREGIQTDPKKISAVADWPAPTTVRKVRQFVGMASWYRRFVPNFSTIVAPLTKLTGKNARWRWGDTEETAFRTLKNALTTAPVLACPDFRRPFTLQTDASTVGLGAVLTQEFDEGERVIAYASRTLNPAERNYSATELECLAVVWGIRRMRDYLEGYRFYVITDHQSLKWLRRLESPSGRLSRWLCELQQYDFEIQYRRGSLNHVADALSRQPEACAASRAIHCRWYQRLVEKVRQHPEEHPDYDLRNDKLYRHIRGGQDIREYDEEEQWRECVPTPARQELIRRLHDEPTAGHLGVAKTIARVARLYYWPGMFRDIARYVGRCEQCARHKAHQQRPAGYAHQHRVRQPWEQVTLDLVGPLPRSTNGHIWLLNMQDRFSKWVEMVPLRQATGEAVTRALRDQVVYRHGCPDTVISDNGRQFCSRSFRALLQDHGIRHRTTPVYTPQCNPVERTNRTLKTMISQYVGNRHRTWDQHLTALQYAYNSARHDATGYSPAVVNYGREMPAPHPQDRPRQNTTRDVPSVIKRLEDIREIVRMNLDRAFERQAPHYNLRRRNWRPKIGEIVWRRERPLSDKNAGRNAKLAPKFSGPYTIRRIVSPVIVDLKGANGRWLRHIHIQDLKPAPTTAVEPPKSVKPPKTS